MDFSGDMALWQRKVAEGPEGIARRMAAFEALALAPRQAILDLGCGGGHLVREVALAVGREGRATGVDVSPDQLAAARDHCAEAPGAEFIEADATALPLEDAAFDGVASIQTLEYIPAVDRALAEIRRVLKRGGRVALVSVLWDHWRFHGADPALTDRVLDAWRAHCPHQMLPLAMPRLLEAAGFGGVTRRPIAFVNGALHENTYAFWAAKVSAAFATTQGVPEADAQRWLEQLAEADRAGRFGFVSVPVLTTATAV